MWGDKVRRRQSTEALCCFTPPSPPLSSVRASIVVCLFTEWLDLTRRNVHLFPLLLRLLLQSVLLPLLFSIHVSPLSSISLPVCLPLCLCVFFSLVLPLRTPDLTLEAFRLITLGIFLAFWTLLPRSAPRLQERLRANYPPSYWLPQTQELWFTWGDIQFKHTDLCNLFLWKTINSAAFSSASLSLFAVPSLFSPRATPLPPCLPLPLAIVFAQTDKIYCQKNEGVCEVWLAKIFYIFLS